MYKAVRSPKIHLDKHQPKVQVDMFNIGSGRLKDLDNAIISPQVISHVPALEPLSVYQTENNQLFSAVRKHPKRSADYALLPAGSGRRGCEAVALYQGAGLRRHTDTESCRGHV